MSPSSSDAEEVEEGAHLLDFALMLLIALDPKLPRPQVVGTFPVSKKLLITWVQLNAAVEAS